MQSVADATFDDLTMIGSWLCEADRVELAATRDPDDYVALARDAWKADVKKVVLDEARPVMAFGASRTTEPGKVLVWGFKTEAGWKTIPIVTKYLKRVMIPALQAQGMRRAVCIVHPDNVRSIKWLEHLGFLPAAALVGIGIHGEDMLLYQRTDPDAHPPGHA